MNKDEIIRRAKLLAEGMSRQRKASAAKGIIEFAEVYLSKEPHRHLKHAPGAMHRKACSCLEQVVRKGRTLFVWAAAREHGKTTICISCLLWLICFRRVRFVLIVSNTETQAQSTLSDLKRELSANALLREDFPDVCEPPRSKPRPTRWKVSEIVTRNDIRVMAVGTGSEIRGLKHGESRPDLILLDDAESAESVRTREARQRTSDWFHETVLNTKDKDGSIFVVGTVLHKEGLVAECLGRPDIWTGQKDAAFDADGNPAWPERWSKEDLEERRRTIGPTRFSREFMNQPVAPESQVVKEEYLRFYQDAPGDLRLFIGVDPAIKIGSERADYSAFSVIGMSAQRQVWVLHVERARMEFHSQIEKVAELNAFWKPQVIAIECNGPQEVWYQELLRAGIPKHQLLPLRPTTDKTTRITTILQPLFARGDVFLKQGWTDFIEEILDFPGAAHDDGVDSLANAVTAALQTPSYATPMVEVLRGPTHDEAMVQDGPTKVERIVDNPGGNGWTTYSPAVCDLLGIPRSTRTRR